VRPNPVERIHRDSARHDNDDHTGDDRQSLGQSFDLSFFKP
jgi:hypothetical protein